MRVNIVIPMAGLGSRFIKENYDIPKPFIDVDGKMMIERVLDNMAYSDSDYTLIIRKSFLYDYKDRIDYIRSKYKVSFITVDKLTYGTACTVCAAHKIINNSKPLLIVNSDQVVDIDIADFIDDSSNRHLDGSILVFKDDDPKWSFVRMNNEGFVTEVREKQPISNKATVGIYLFSRGKDFISGALDMIAQMDRVNGEFYVAIAYNYLIKDNQKIGIFEIDKEQMHGIGTPSDLQKYISFLRSDG